MQVNNSFLKGSYEGISIGVKKELKEGDKLRARDITDAYLAGYQLKISLESKEQISLQVETFSLKDIGYEGKAIKDLTQNEAKELFGKDGFFGIDKTSDRIADFVLKGARDDVSMLRAGREGILRGFDEAEKLWGGKLPEISYKTIEKALEAVDKKLASLGVSVVDIDA